MFFPTGLVAVILNLISGYALKQSLTSISNIKNYENKAEKAAGWSDTAKSRLWDTRYTIGAGFVSVSLFLCYLILGHCNSEYLLTSAVPCVTLLRDHLFSLCPLRRKRLRCALAINLACSPGRCIAFRHGAVYGELLGYQGQCATPRPVQCCHQAEHGDYRTLGCALGRLGNDDGAEAVWTVRAAGENLGLIGPSRPFSRKKLGFSIGLDEVDVFVTHAESILKVDARLVRKGHPGLEEYLCVPFVEVWGLVGCKTLARFASIGGNKEG